MAKKTSKSTNVTAGAKRGGAAPASKRAAPKAETRKSAMPKIVRRQAIALKPKPAMAAPPKLARVLSPAADVDATVLDRLADTVFARRAADPMTSHSARLLSRGTAKVAQKFGEEAVECLIEAVAGNREALVAESADVLYHLIVLWVDAGLAPSMVWEELSRREGISGIAEKARRKIALPTNKIP